jgi:CubicO group peptidase (beta-lactamase class C family)
MNPLRVTLLLLAALVFCVPARDDAADSKAIAAAITKAMKEWSVPGVAIAIVRDDKVIYLAGHGVRAVGENEKVTPDTLFALGSCSKAFTTAAMAALVDEKKLHWDDHVRKHLKWFHLSDPLADGDVRLRDLMCHRTGVGSHDALWYRTPWTPEETARRLAKLPLDKPFRTTFQYQSTMFTAAGLAAASAAGTPWGEVIQKRLLDPLGMKNTRLNSKAALAMPDIATGHRLDDAGQAVRMPRYVMVGDAAGSIHSSARDLATWLRFHLNEGMLDGKRIVSARELGETHTPQIVLIQPPIQRMLFPDTVQMSYGLAWVISDYRGLRVLGHGGAIDGFRTQITFLPEKKLGIAIVSNLQQTSMNMALTNVLIDLLLDLPKRNWHSLHRKCLERMAAAANESRQQLLARRQAHTRPSSDPSAYTGSYEHPAYGTVKIDFKRGALWWEWRNDTGRMEHLHNDTFILGSDLTGLAEIVFVLDRAGKVERFTVTGKLSGEFRKVGQKK